MTIDTTQPDEAEGPGQDMTSTITGQSKTTLAIMVIGIIAAFTVGATYMRMENAYSRVEVKIDDIHALLTKDRVDIDKLVDAGITRNLELTDMRWMIKNATADRWSKSDDMMHMSDFSRVNSLKMVFHNRATSLTSAREGEEQ